MSNKLPTSIDAQSDQSDYVRGRGSRFLQSEKGQVPKGVVISYDQLYSAETTDRYPMVASIIIGEEADKNIVTDGVGEFTIVDMRSLVSDGEYKTFRDSNIEDDVPFILVGRGIDGADAIVSLRPGDVFDYGRTTPATDANDRRRRFASNDFISREQFGIYVNEDGGIAVYDKGSANGTTVKWGISQETTPQTAEVSDETMPRSKLLLGGLASQAVLEKVAEKREAFASVQDAINDVHKAAGEFESSRIFGHLTQDVLRGTDASKEKIMANARELAYDLGTINDDQIDMLGLTNNLETLSLALKHNDFETAKSQIGTITASIGDSITKRSRWFDEKTQYSDSVGSSASAIMAIPEKHFRRAVNAGQTVNGQPVLEFLKAKIN